MAVKRFATMGKMLRSMGLGDEKQIAEHESRMAKRKFIQRLIAERLKRDVSQKDMATRMECTQSRISKMEAGTDDELKWGEIRQYLGALGLGLTYSISSKGNNLIEQVDLHASAIRRINRLMAKRIVPVATSTPVDADDDEDDLPAIDVQTTTDELQMA